MTTTRPPGVLEVSAIRQGQHVKIHVYRPDKKVSFKRTLPGLDWNAPDYRKALARFEREFAAHKPKRDENGKRVTRPTTRPDFIAAGLGVESRAHNSLLDLARWYETSAEMTSNKANTRAKHMRELLYFCRAPYTTSAGVETTYGEVDALVFTPSDVLAYCQRLLDAGRKSKRDNFVVALRAAYYAAAKDETMGKRRGFADKVNPAQKLGIARDTSEGHDLWPDEYADMFCAKFVEGTMPRFVFEMATRTALRLGDLHAIGPQHVTPDKRHWKFTEAKGKGSTSRNRKGKDKPRTFKISPDMWRLLKMTKTGALHYIVNAYGDPFRSKDRLGKRFTSWARQAGIPAGYTLHGLRALAAVLVYEATVEAGGDGITAAMELLGHSDPKMTMHYLRARQKQKQVDKATNILDIAAARRAKRQQEAA